MSRTNILADFQKMSYDRTNPNLLKLWDYGHIFSYPNVNANDKNTVAGREGDKFLLQLPFQLETNPLNGVMPILQSITVAIVATKTGKKDFIVEQASIYVGASCVYNSQQNPKINTLRNYITFPNDPYNTISLVANSAYNPTTGTFKGYLFSYPFTLRYDSWNSINPVAPGASSCSDDIDNDIQNVNNSWSNLVQNGWTLFLRTTFNVEGYDGYVTPYQYQQSITCFSTGGPSTLGPNYSGIISYYDINGVLQQGILPGAKTRISVKFAPDSVGLPDDYDGYIGTFFMDILNTGGVTSRRFANTEVPSETNSPWSPAPKNGSPDIYYANGNLSINIFNATGIVIVEGFYDDTILQWFQTGKKPIFVGSLNLKDDALETAGGQDIETAGDQTITK